MYAYKQPSRWLYRYRDREKQIISWDSLVIFSAEIMLWFKEVVLFCFVIEVNKRRTSYVALTLPGFWLGFESLHRVIHRSLSLPKYSPSWILVGLGFFIYFRLFTHQTEHILLLCFLHIYFSFLSFTFCHLKRETLSKPLCLIGLSVPQESQDPRSVSILFWGPFTGQSHGLESGSSAVGRVTQSEHSRDPVPGLLNGVCYSLQALVMPLRDSHWTFYGIASFIW